MQTIANASARTGMMSRGLTIGSSLPDRLASARSGAGSGSAVGFKAQEPFGCTDQPFARLPVRPRPPAGQQPPCFRRPIRRLAELAYRGDFGDQALALTDDEGGPTLGCGGLPSRALGYCPLASRRDLPNGILHCSRTVKAQPVNVRASTGARCVNSA